MYKKRADIIIIVAFPILLLVGILLIPVVPDYTDHKLAEQAVSQTARWFSGHLLSAVAFGLANLSVGTITSHLNQLSSSSSPFTRPFIALGSGLYAAGLGADGIGPLAVKAAGQSPVLFFEGSGWMVTGTFVAGTIIFGIGLLSMIIWANQQGFLQGAARFVSFLSVFIFMGAPMILSGYALFGVALAVFGVFTPFALALSKKH